MKDAIIQDSLKVAEQVMSANSDKGDSTNIWMWIAIGEFAVIIGLLLTKKLKRKTDAKLRFKEEALRQDVDFNNIIKSSFHSTELYDILKVKCHPDRFPTDPELNAMAGKLFQEITKNKTNHKRLEELKLEAQNKLNINF